MEQRTGERGSSDPHFLLRESQRPIPAIEGDSDSSLWPSSDEDLVGYSASSKDDTPGLFPSFDVRHRSDHELEESRRDDASQRPITPSPPFERYCADTYAILEGRHNSVLIPSEEQRGINSYAASTSLEDAIVAYFVAQNLETPGFSHSVACDPTQVAPTPYTERQGAEPSYSTSTTSSDSLNEETGQTIRVRRFGPLLTIDHKSLIDLAMDVRNSMLTEHEECSSCRVIDRQNGSFNLVYILQFDDGLKYVIRLPTLGWGKRWTSTAKTAFESQVLTMHLIRRMTKIPLPEVYAFDATQRNSLKTPYMVISFISGVTVETLWNDETNPALLELRRSRILGTTAMAMAQLQNLKFSRIGSLQSNNRLDDMSISIGPCYDWDMPSRHSEMDGKNLNLREFGPFRTTIDYLSYVHDIQERDPHPVAVGCRKLLTRMIEILPLSVDDGFDVGNDETFVLTAPEFDSQNFMVDEHGNLTGIIDWDHVQTMPRCLGYCSYPEWITLDCDPSRYNDSRSRTENLPVQLQRYRQQYAAEMTRQLRGQGDARFAKKSHIFGAVKVAASRNVCQVPVMAKLLDRALAREKYVNKFHLMGGIGEGDSKVSEAKVMDTVRALFEVQPVEMMEVAKAEIE